MILQSCLHLWLSLANLSLALQTSIFTTHVAQKQVSSSTLGEFRPDSAVPQAIAIAAGSGSSSTAKINGLQTAEPTNQHQPQEDQHSSTGTSHNFLNKPQRSSDPPRNQREFLEPWPEAIKRLRPLLKKFKSGYYNSFVLPTKHLLNQFEKHNQVAIFSEIDHLQHTYGEAYQTYKSLDSAGQKRYWEIYNKEGNAESSGLSPRLARTSTLGREGKNKAAVTTKSRVRSSQRMANWAMDLLKHLERNQHEYDTALSTSINLVENFVQKFSNNGRVSDVSRRIRDWKSRNPSRMPTLKYAYQADFINLFGPGDLAKPSLNDPTELTRLKKLWHVNSNELEAILKASSEVKSMLADLYTAKEKDVQRGRWISFLRSSTELIQAFENACDRQDTIHRDLQAAFGDEQTLLHKMKDIAAMRTPDEEWTDRQFTSVYYDLLPFIDPLRPGRRHEDYPDITPLLQQFGLHTTPRAMAELMKLSEALVPFLRVQYTHQILARDFRKSLEASFDGLTQHQIPLLLKRTAELLSASPTPARPRYLLMLDAVKDSIYRFFNNLKSSRISSFKPPPIQFPSFRPPLFSFPAAQSMKQTASHSKD